MFSKGSVSVLNSSTASGRMSGSVGIRSIRHDAIVQSGERIAKLKEKIDGIQVSIEREKNSQIEQINSHLESLDERLKQAVDARGAVISTLTSEVSCISPRKIGN